MPTIHCQCSAKYRFPESARGRNARCKKCGNEFRLEEDDGGTIPIATDSDPMLDVAPPDIPSGHMIFEKEDEVSEPLVARALPSHGYGQSLLWTVLFLASVRNLVTFVMIILLIAIAGMIPLVVYLVAMWYAAYRYSIIESAAAGEDDIPSAAISTDILDDFLFPMLRWVGSTIIVMVPAAVYALLRSRTQRDFATKAGEMIASGPAGLLDIFGFDPTLFVLVCAGLAAWPIVILCVALGGFASLIRLDLILRTLVRSAPAYLVTILIIAAATAAEAEVLTLISTSIFVSAAVTVYCDIVMCRAIGLYYHHFKHKFAWSWG